MDYKDFFAEIDRHLFPNTDVKQISEMNDDEQRAFMLQQVDKLLEQRHFEEMEWCVNMLWEEKDGEWKVRIESPLFDPKQRELMDDDERVVCAFYVSTIGLCRALINAEEFSPMTLGIDGDEEFLVDNEPLIDFVLDSPYKHISAQIAYTMYRKGIDSMAMAFYAPAQNYLANLYCDKHKAQITTPLGCNIPAEDYIYTIVNALKAVEAHLAEGFEMGLTEYELFLHDELYGKFMTSFDKNVVDVAKQLCAYMDKQMPNLSDIYFPEATWKEQSEDFRTKASKEIDNFCAMAIAIANATIGEDWLTEDSLALNYLEDHASRKLTEERE